MRAATLPLRAGRWLVGVSPRSPELRRALADALAARLVDGVEAPATYRLRTSPADGSYVLRQGCATLLRTSSFAATLAALEDILHLYDTESAAVQLEAVGLVGEGGALVVDPGLRGRLVNAPQRLAAHGLTSLPTPYVAVETGAGTLLAGPNSADPGPHPVAVWAWRDPGHDRRWPWSTEVVRQANASVRNRDEIGAQATLETLAASVEAAHAVAIPVPPPGTEELIELILGGTAGG